MSSFKLMSRVRSGLWLIPLLFALAGIALNALTVTLDRVNDYRLIPPEWLGGPEAALAILSTVSASMITLVATVLAITMVVVQLAMQQFSPRIVQTFLQDRPSQIAIGLFVATFVQSMLAMREVFVTQEEGLVPGVSVIVTFAMVVVDIVVLVVYVHHIGRSLRVSALIELVGKNTRDLVNKLYSTRLPGRDGDDPHIILAPHSGALTVVREEQLVEIAMRADARIELLVPIGQFVPGGAPFIRVHGATVDAIDIDDVHGAILLSLERTLDQDVAFGLRMLVDMGAKAIAESPYNDPTTTVQVIDRIHDILRQLATLELPDGVRYDERGTPRLVVPSMDWQAYVRLAFEELRLVGRDSLQVVRSLRAALQDLKRVAPPERQGPLDEQLGLLTSAIDGAATDGDERELFLRPDPQGLGVAAGAEFVSAADR